MNWFERISIQPVVCHGKACIQAALSLVYFVVSTQGKFHVDHRDD